MGLHDSFVDNNQSKDIRDGSFFTLHTQSDAFVGGGGARTHQPFPGPEYEIGHLSLSDPTVSASNIYRYARCPVKFDLSLKLFAVLEGFYIKSLKI